MKKNYYRAMAAAIAMGLAAMPSVSFAAENESVNVSQDNGAVENETIDASWGDGAVENETIDASWGDGAVENETVDVSWNAAAVENETIDASWSDGAVENETVDVSWNAAAVEEDGDGISLDGESGGESEDSDEDWDSEGEEYEEEGEGWEDEETDIGEEEGEDWEDEEGTDIDEEEDIDDWEEEEDIDDWEEEEDIDDWEEEEDIDDWEEEDIDDWEEEEDIDDWEEEEDIDDEDWDDTEDTILDADGTVEEPADPAFVPDEPEEFEEEAEPMEMMPCTVEDEVPEDKASHVAEKTVSEGRASDMAKGVQTGKNRDAFEMAQHRAASSRTVSGQVEYAAAKDRALAGVYQTDAKVNLYSGAGEEKAVLAVTEEKAEVYCYGYYTEKNEEKWLCVQYFQDGKAYIGFCKSSQLKKGSCTVVRERV